MKVLLKDGSSKEYAEPMAIIDIAKDISEGLARVACVAELDGEAVDLRTVVDGEHELNILTFDSEEGKAAYRHTASHVLAQAIKRLYPEAKCAIGPSIADGFYYDFDMESLDREALDKIEKEMKVFQKNRPMAILPKQFLDMFERVQDMEEQLKAARPARVFITHSVSDEALVREVADYLQSLHVFAEILETRAGGVVSSHCGPGTLGVLFIA